jgi:hypothetical protein
MTYPAPYNEPLVRSPRLAVRLYRGKKRLPAVLAGSL